MNRHFQFAAFLAVATLPAIASAIDFPAVGDLKPQVGLPDPLVMFSGEKVKSKEQWEQARRPELKALFQHYMYGYLPPKPEEVKYEVRLLDEKYLEGKATLSEVTISFIKPALKHKLHVLLLEPNSKSPAPAFIGRACKQRLEHEGDHNRADQRHKQQHRGDLERQQVFAHKRRSDLNCR